MMGLRGVGVVKVIDGGPPEPGERAEAGEEGRAKMGLGLLLGLRSLVEGLRLVGGAGLLPRW